MKRTITVLASTCIILVVLSMLYGCGGGGGHQVGSSGPVTFANGTSGRLVLIPEIQTSAQNFAILESQYAAQVKKSGATFDEKNTAITLPHSVLNGYWVRINGKIFMADVNGVFTLPAGTSGTVADVLKDAGDTVAFTQFPLSGLDKTGKATNDVPIQLIHQGPIGMNDSSVQPQSVLDCCQSTSSSKKPNDSSNGVRCLDWDGPYGDLMIHPHADPRALLDYIDSTCWNYVDLGICANEGATIRNTITFSDGPHCFDNHKFRFCQDIVESNFDLTASDSNISPGGSVTITVTNNTAGNDTVLALSGPGQLQDPQGETGTFITVHHYNSTQHLIQRQITCTVNGDADVGSTITIIAQSHGHTKTVTLNVSGLIVGTWSSLYVGQGGIGTDIIRANGTINENGAEFTYTYSNGIFQYTSGDMERYSVEWIDSNDMVWTNTVDGRVYDETRISSTTSVSSAHSGISPGEKIPIRH